MPASSKRQKRFMAAELGRAERGQKTQTGMAPSQLKDFVKAPIKRKRKGKGS